MTFMTKIACTALLSSLLLGCVDPTDDASSEVSFDEDQNHTISQPIVGGQDTAINTVPWQVSLRSFGGHICGGSIVAPGWVVTAAHCVDTARASSLSVESGTSTLGRGQTRQVSRVIVHPSYNPRSPITRGFDIALLELSSPITLSNSAAIIPVVDTQAAAQGATDAGVISVNSGWGLLRTGGRISQVLQSISIPIVSNAQASRAYGTTIGSTLIAAGLAQGGQSACQGDSGGPLVVNVNGQALLAGVVSFGPQPCARPGVPAVYTRVESFVPWMSQFVTLTTASTSTPSQPTPPTPPSASPVIVRSGQPIAVPDGSNTQRSVTLSDTFALSTIEINLTINHAFPSDLAFVLGAPNGQRILLEQPRQNSSPQRSYVVNSFAGLSVQGQWTLEFYDVVTPDAGSVDSVEITFNP